MLMDHIGQIPAFAAGKFGPKEALVFEGRSFTFLEIHDLVEKAAGGLAAQGVNQGDIVTLYAANSWEWVISYYAIARLGAVINPCLLYTSPSPRDS